MDRNLRSRPAHHRAHLCMDYANEQVRRLLRGAGPVAGEPDGAEQGASGVQPRAFHQVMLSKPDWLRVQETPMDPHLGRFHSLFLYVVLIYQGESQPQLFFLKADIWK